MEQPLVSVIIPVYNVEAYLPRCLDSVSCQSYSNLEVIMVDDGSTDHSGLICEEYVSKDSRFRVIHQENKWLSGARNTGLDAACGEFVCFVDSDDWVHPDYVSTLLEGYRKGADISIVGFDKVLDDGSPFIEPIEERYSLTTFGRKDCLIELINGLGVGGFMFGVVWNKMYHRRLIGDLRFQPFYSLEDAPFNLCIFSQVNQVSINPVPMYHYVQRDGSIMSKGNLPMPKVAYNRFLAFGDMCANVPSDEPDIKVLMLRKLFGTHSLGYRDATLGSPFEGPMKKAFKNTWKRYGREYLSSHGVPVKEKTLVSLCWLFPFFWEFYKSRKS